MRASRTRNISQQSLTAQLLAAFFWLNCLIVLSISAQAVDSAEHEGFQSDLPVQQIYVFRGEFKMLVGSHRFNHQARSLRIPARSQTSSPLANWARTDSVKMFRLVASHPRVFAPTNDIWNGGNGAWSVAGNWSGGVPNSNSNVLIDNGNSKVSNVTLDIGDTINNLSVDSDDSLSFSNNNSLTINGTSITNAGAINLDSGGNATELIINGAVTLSGGGTINLSNNSQNFIAGTGTLTNQNNEIQGSGNFGNGQLTIVNGGTINADQGTPLIVQPGAPSTNTGILEATNGATLHLLGSSWTNTGGTIEAIGANSFVQLDGTTIKGGTLNSSGTNAVVGTTTSATLDGTTSQVNNTGTYDIFNNASTTFLGTINNTGTIILGSGGNGTFFDVGASGTTTLTGGGTVSMSNNSQNFFSNTGTLLNVNNTISGGGNIGNAQMTLNNQGTIDANQSTPLFIQPGSGGATNTGTLEATAGATLHLLGSTFNNLGGTILASGSGSFVQLDNTTVSGGTLNTSGGGIVGTTTSATLDGTTNQVNNVGSFEIFNNATGTLLGTINNTGTIILNSGGNATIFSVGNGTTTLTGGGTVNLSNNSQNLFSGTSSGKLVNSNNTIEGSGNVGNGQITIVNQGTIDANQSTQLFVQPGSGGVTNTGTMEAINAANLHLFNGTFSNNGGVIEAIGTNSTVQLDSATITGGTLTTNTGGLIFTNTAATLDGTTNQVTNSGTFQVNNNSTVNLLGTINNTGTIQLASGGNGTFINVGSGTVTLTGMGTVAMSNNSQNYFTGTGTLINANNLIEGSGNIGNGQMTLNNKNTIDANQSTQLFIQSGAGGVTNTGTLEATNGANLHLLGGTFTNNTGTIQAVGSGSTVQLDSATIVGGTLTSSGGGEIFTSTAATLDGTTNTLTNAGTYLVDNNASTTILGTINNTGTIQLGSGGNGTFLNVGAGTTTLTGAGTVMMSNNSQNFIAGPGTLVNSTNTIEGSGNIGNGQMTFINKATVDANQSTPLTIQPGAGGTTNTGTLEATAGATLILSGGTFTNTGGTILASGSGSNVSLASSTITGGTLKTSSGGVIDTTTSATIIGLTNAGALNVANNASLTMKGNIVNTGTIALGSGGNGTFLLVNGAVTLSGAGKVTLSNNSQNFISGATGSDKLTNKSTIQGSGNIGNNSMGLVNAGTILANQSTALFIDTNSVGFNNTGKLVVNTGSLMDIDGTFNNFSGSTLTGGTYQVSGTLQFNNANIVTNAASITLTGPSSQIIDQSSNNALANFAINKGTFALAGGRSFTTAGNFTNSGTLNVGSGSTFDVNGTLSNFSGTTLTGGTYLVSGTFQFNNANIVTDAAKITLTGTGSKIIDQSSNNALANFAAITSAGSFSLAGGRAFTTIGNFSSAGKLTIGSGTTFTVGGPGMFTQTAGTTTDSGTLAASGMYSLQGGTLFGTGKITGNLQSGALVAPGTSLTTTGILTDAGTYTQGSGASLDIGIAGTTPGTKYDQFNPTTATLNGTLNISLLKSFVPTIGSQFKILNFTSETGTFTTVNGLSINQSEHFTITYQPTDVLLTVVSGPLFGMYVPSRPNVDGGNNRDRAVWSNDTGRTISLNDSIRVRNLSAAAFTPSASLGATLGGMPGINAAGSAQILRNATPGQSVSAAAFSNRSTFSSAAGMSPTSSMSAVSSTTPQFTGWTASPGSARSRINQAFTQGLNSLHLQGRSALRTPRTMVIGISLLHPRVGIEVR